MGTPDTIDIEPENAEPTALERRRPDIPVTLSELAALKGEAIEVIEARVQVLETLRRAAIRATSPEDWLLFKSPDEQGGQVVGYLQDCGADRVRDLYGIEIFDVSKPEKIVGQDPAVFTYIINGSGRCKLTRQVVEQVEGGRSSTDDFCKGKTGAELELTVRKATRANLDGNLTRELAGMKSVPVDQLAEAWVGTKKSIDQCRRGRGFGTRDERVGGRSEKAPDVEPPVCPHCNSKGVYRPAKGDRKPFYGCPNYAKHADKKFIVDAAKWIAEQAQKAAAVPVTTSELPREPGAEGWIMKRPAIVQSVFDFAIREINALEERIVKSENDADAMLWEQAGQVVEQLKTVSLRRIAKQWINARTGDPYAHMHVSWVAQVYSQLYTAVPRPRFRDAYNEIAHPAPTAHVSHNSGDNEWYTPTEYIEAARQVLGAIDLDPASCALANDVVKAKRYFTIDDDGLKQQWRGRVWMNPPYATPLIDRFAEKLAASVLAGDVSAAVVLVNNATETEWFLRLAAVAAAVCFPSRRVRFWQPDRDELAAPLQGQAVLYIGRAVTRFFYTFENVGLVVVKAHLVPSIVQGDVESLES